jgi:hypothetical protein
LQLNNKQFQWLFLVSNAKRYNQEFSIKKYDSLLLSKYKQRLLFF